jgi:Zn-dependent protease with chaperone function
MLSAYAWQVTLHSCVLGLIFYAWAHYVRLPSGQTKRRLLAALLVLPMLTAAVPGRSSLEFAEGMAWLNSGRLLAIPLPADFLVRHAVALIGLMLVALTIWQELLPALRRPLTTDSPVPESLATFVRAQPGWERCTVALSPLQSVMLATGGVPRRPRLIVSCGAIESLSIAELETVVVHEHAHWEAGRWTELHALFAVRLLQCYNPVALWVFREYCVEMEVACDAVAVSGRNPSMLARILLKIYESTDRRDVAARGSLKKRVDVLLGGGPADAALPPVTVAAACAVMALVLPWIV